MSVQEPSMPMSMQLPGQNQARERDIWSRIENIPAAGHGHGRSTLCGGDAGAGGSFDDALKCSGADRDTTSWSVTWSVTSNILQPSLG